MYTGDRRANRISSPRDHIGRHFLGHDRANDERFLGIINRECTSAGKASLHSGSLPGNTDALCQHFSPVQNLVYGQNLAGPKHIRTTIDNHHYMVYLKKNSLPSDYQHYNNQNKWEDGRCRILRRSVRYFSYTVCTCKSNGMER